MGLAELQLRQTADTAVATREQAIAFANAALAKRRHTGDPMRDYTPKERERARAIFAVCREYYGLRLKGGMSRTAAARAVSARGDLTAPLDGLKMGARTLDEWLGNLGGSVKDATAPRMDLIYVNCRDYGKGAAKRIRQNVMPDEFMEEFWNAFGTQNAMLVAPAYRTAREICLRNGVTEIPELHRVRNWIRTRVNERVLAKARLTDEKYQAGFGGYVMRDWNCEVGAVWVGDHRILDVWVKVRIPEGDWVAMRPWVTAWMDVKSGFMVAAVIYADAYPSHTKILEALYYGIKTNGNRAPQKLLTDNGKDYLKAGALKDARLQPTTQPTRGANRYCTLVEETLSPVLEHAHSVARELGTDAETCAPYKGQQKPIERRFRDFAQEFDRLWPGYTGNTPGNRPDYGQTYRGNPETLPTCAEVVEAFREWLGRYHSRPNESRITGGEPPAELWARREELTPAFTDEQLYWAMLVPHRNALQVRRGPSACDVWYHGWPYRGATPDDCLRLRDHWKSDVMVKTSWAPEATFRYGERVLPTRAWAFALDGTYICDLTAEKEISVWGKSERKKKLLEAAMHSRKTAEKADREDRNMLRGRKTVAFPARKLYPHGSGETPEIEGGTAVAGSIMQGPGKGRAKRLLEPDTPPAAELQESTTTTARERAQAEAVILAAARRKREESENAW